jgi:hypothetical protein
MDARHDSETKLTREETYLHFARGDETKLLGLRKTTRPNSRGLNAETRMAGIEPMGEISLLTFLFIGLPDRRSTDRSHGLIDRREFCPLLPRSCCT